MYSFQSILLITLTALVLVVATVMLHYQCLSFLSKQLRKVKSIGRPRMVLLIIALLAVHIVEIWIFAAGLIAVSNFPELGYLKGVDAQPVLLDYVYYSAITYTTVGFGDFVPVGPLRFLAAMEALLGLMLVAWSASFTYIEMNAFWKDK